MSAFARRVAFAAAAALGAAVLLVSAVLIGGNTGPGLRAVAGLANALSGGEVTVTGLGGRFPDALTAAHVELRDDGGVWLTLDGVAVDWSPLALLGNHVDVATARVGRARLLRWPKSTAQTEGEGPVVRVGSLTVGAVEILRAVAGAPARLSLSASGRYRSLDRMRLDLTAKRLDAAGSYRVDLRAGKQFLRGDVDIHEPAHGLLAGLAGLPGIGPLTIRGTASGPPDADAVTLEIAAGALRANVQGVLDLVARTARLDATANAPAMRPASDVAWDGLTAEAHLWGSLDAPDASAHFEAANARAADASVARLVADVSGTNGKIALSAAANGLRIPGADPDLLAAAPVTLHAMADVEAKSKRVDFLLSHPLATAEGRMQASGEAKSIAADVTLSDLAPLSVYAGRALQGSAHARIEASEADGLRRLSADGTVALTGGDKMLAALFGRNGTFAVALRERNGDLDIERLSATGPGIDAALNGTRRGGAYDLGWTAAFANVALLAPDFRGRATAKGTLRGTDGDFAVTADADGDLASAGFAPAPVTLSLDAQHLPRAAEGSVRMRGTFDASPVQVAAALGHAGGGALRLSIARGDWRSVHVTGDIALGAQASGKARVTIGNLADLAPFTGTRIAGSADAAIDMTHEAGKPLAKIDATARDLSVPEVKAGRLKIAGAVADPLGLASYALHFAAEDADIAGYRGRVQGELAGKGGAPSVRVSANLRDESGHAIGLAGEAALDVSSHRIDVARLAADYRGAHLHLDAPASIGIADGVRIAELRAHVDGAAVTASGELTPALDARATVTGMDGATLAKFAPDLNLSGTFDAAAALTGTLQAPEGTIDVKGERVAWGNAAGIAPTALSAHAVLHGKSLALNANLTNGKALRFAAKGEVPLAPDGALDLDAEGTLDLALFDPLLNVRGRSLHGKLQIAAHAAGSLARPRVEGSGALSGGEFRDYGNGIRLRDIAAKFAADGETIRIDGLTAKAGDGAVSGGGTIDLGAAGMPVDIALTARKARPLSSDKLTATVDADLKIGGKLEGGLEVSGTVKVARADITLPESFTAPIAQLDLRRPGRKTPPPDSGAGRTVALNLKVSAPERVFVRGRGLDSEVSGDLTVTGTADRPAVGGALNLRRGDISLAGRRLEFTSGSIAFNGEGVEHKLDPVLDFTAENTSGSVTAKLQIAGYASAPKVVLTSTPSLPQDEVLAHLLFQESVKQLSPFELAEMAQALAALGGVGTGLGDPLARVRSSLGLDRLAVTSATTGETQVQAGKYVARGVYVGAARGLAGTTQGEVQIDLTKNLKLQAAVTAAADATATATTAAPVERGSSIGLSYTFEY